MTVDLHKKRMTFERELNHVILGGSLHIESADADKAGNRERCLSIDIRDQQIRFEHPGHVFSAGASIANLIREHALKVRVKGFGQFPGRKLSFVAVAKRYLSNEIERGHVHVKPTLERVVHQGGEFRPAG